jgi:hypothetical protein
VVVGAGLHFFFDATRVHASATATVIEVHAVVNCSAGKAMNIHDQGHDQGTEHHRHDSSWPTTRRWLESVLQPVMVAILIAGLVTLMALRDDMQIVKVRLTLIEQNLHMPKVIP